MVEEVGSCEGGVMSVEGAFCLLVKLCWPTTLPTPRQLRLWHIVWTEPTMNSVSSICSDALHTLQVTHHYLAIKEQRRKKPCKKITGLARDFFMYPVLLSSLQNIFSQIIPLCWQILLLTYLFKDICLEQDGSFFPI